VGGPHPVLLTPTRLGCRDRIDLWFEDSAVSRGRGLKLAVWSVLKGIKFATGWIILPTLSQAIWKGEVGAG